MNEARPRFRGKTFNELSDELFRKIQESQGYFFVADEDDNSLHTYSSIEGWFERLRGRLEWGREAVHVLNEFLRKYGQRECDLESDAKHGDRR